MEVSLNHKTLPLVIVLAFLSACGNSKPIEADGTIAVVDGVHQVIHDEAQLKTVCASNYCEPNYIVHAVFGRKHPKPDPVFGTKDKYDYSRAKMNLKPAWDITEGNPEIIVADVDSGADLQHPDLVDNLVPGFDFTKNVADASDEAGHGTHTAGIIAALKNDTGTVGVAPHIKVMPLKFLGADGSGTTSNAILAINYAVAHGAKIISASWGGPTYSVLLAEAVKNAIDAGVVFVAAAGNDAVDMTNNPFYPALYDNVISVASTNEGDALSSFSNYSQSKVTLSAPGENIYSTYLKHGYQTMSGTSMACPQVSGAIALALSKNKSILPGAIRAALCASTDSPTRDSTQCGRINIGRFVQSI